MNQSMDSDLAKTIYVFLGFVIPLMMLAIYLLLGWGNLPLMIIVLTWLGFSILFYMGLTDEELTQ